MGHKINVQNYSYFYILMIIAKQCLKDDILKQQLFRQRKILYDIAYTWNLKNTTH